MNKSGFGYPDNITAKEVEFYRDDDIIATSIEYHLKTKKPIKELKKPHRMVKQDITKEEFEAILTKTIQPINKVSYIKSDLEKSET